MKLLKDFGVRALLAFIAMVCFYSVVFWILHSIAEFTTEFALAVLAIAAVPVNTALNFYFMKKEQTP